MDYVLGIDIGTSYFKLGLFRKDGELCGLGRVYVHKDVGDGSRSEVPTNRFWELLRRGLKDACQQAQTHPDRIQAVAYASQANSFLLLDKDKNPLTPIILWSDNRAEEMKNFSDLFHHKGFLERSGLGVDCTHQFCVSKLLWFQHKQPKLWLRAAHVMTISDYLTYSLTGQTVGDAGTASLLGLLDIQTFEWQQNIIDLSHIQLSMPLLPGTVVGGISSTGAQLLGLESNIPFVVGSLDHHLAGLGAGLGHIADMSESTGTVLACLRFSSEFAPRKNICTGPSQKAGHYFQLAFEDNGAGSLEWYQQNYATQYSYEDLERFAQTVEIGSCGLIAKPNAHKYKGLDGFLNQSLSHQHGHFVRAIMESTALSLLQLVQHLSSDCALPKRIVATGGGAKSNLWLQMKADVLGVEFITTKIQVSACLGAAMLAALAAGWFADLKTAIHQWVKIGRSIQPKPENHARYLDRQSKTDLI